MSNSKNNHISFFWKNAGDVYTGIPIHTIYCYGGNYHENNCIRSSQLVQKRISRGYGKSYQRELHAALDIAYQSDGAQQKDSCRSEITDQRLSVPATGGRFLYDSL